MEANNGSRADDGNRDNRCHQKWKYRSSRI